MRLNNFISSLMPLQADDSWFVWPWSYYGDNDDFVSTPTQIKSLKHRIGNQIRIIYSQGGKFK